MIRREREGRSARRRRGAGATAQRPSAAGRVPAAFRLLPGSLPVSQPVTSDQQQLQLQEAQATDCVFLFLLPVGRSP